MLWLETHLLWLKAFHIIAIITWMAGLFVYHVGATRGSELAQTFEVMEYRLYRVIMMPAMIFSLASGIILATIQLTWSSGWMHVKLLGVLGLVVFHHALNHWRQSLARGTCQHNGKFFRVINEIPTVLLIIIVICVVIKPF